MPGFPPLSGRSSRIPAGEMAGKVSSMALLVEDGTLQKFHLFETAA
jgi:hypothetical protein